MTQVCRPLSDQEVQAFVDTLGRFQATLARYEQQLFVALLLAAAAERPDVQGYWAPTGALLATFVGRARFVHAGR
jgi:hypothetical protein